MTFELRTRLDSSSNQAVLKLDNVSKITERGLRQGFFQVGIDLARTLNQEFLRKPRSGRTYIIRTRSGRRRRHIASQEGEAPANRTGTLRKSIGWVVRGATQLQFGYGASSSQAPEYARFLEEGTIRMRPRPGLENTVNQRIRNAQVYFGREVVEQFES